jgi:hypothetical protein
MNAQFARRTASYVHLFYDNEIKHERMTMNYKLKAVLKKQSLNISGALSRCLQR